MLNGCGGGDDQIGGGMIKIYLNLKVVFYNKIKNR